MTFKSGNKPNNAYQDFIVKDMDINPYFAIADSDRSYDEKLTECEKLADAHFQSELSGGLFVGRLVGK